MKQFSFFLIFSILFAGCTNPPMVEEPIMEPIVVADPDIFGFTLDENGTKINATVSIVDSGISVESINGSFAFFDVPKDKPLFLIASKDGHRNSTASLRISENLAAQVVFNLPRLSSIPPQSVTTEFRGVFSCKFNPALPCPLESEERFAQYTSHAPESDLNHTQTIAELYWEPSTLEPQTMEVTITSETGTETMEVSPGWRWVVNDPELVYDFQFRVGQGFVLNQEFELFVTHFYNKPGPDGFRIISE